MVYVPYDEGTLPISRARMHRISTSRFNPR